MLFHGSLLGGGGRGLLAGRGFSIFGGKRVLFCGLIIAGIFRGGLLSSSSSSKKEISNIYFFDVKNVSQILTYKLDRSRRGRLVVYSNTR